MQNKQQEQLAPIQSRDIIEAKAAPQLGRTARLAAALANAPAAFVLVKEGAMQTLAASSGLDVTVIDHLKAFSVPEVAAGQQIIVTDALKDPKFKDTALVTGALGLRFYAAFPLVISNGETIGTLGVIDFQHRSLSADQIDGLADLAAIAVNALEAERNARQSASDVLAARTKVAAAERTREYYRSIFNACTESIATFQPISSDDGTITDFVMLNCNDAACTQRGLPREEMLGRTIRELVPNLSDEHFQRYVQVVETGEADQFDNHYNDGHYDDWFRVSAARNSNGGLVLLLAIITEQKKTELQLRRSRDALSSFTAAVSHDLRTPLGHISGFIELIADDLGPDLSEQHQEFMNYVIGGVERMRQLIDAMQKHARLGKIVIERENVAFHELMEAVVARYGAETNEVNADIVLEDLPNLSGDPVLLDQLFSNLLGNALRYRHEARDLRVRITAQQTDKGVLVHVRDNGMGIDPKLHERVFNLFERAVPQSFEIEGLGLGLAMCRAIVSAHGGAICIDPKHETGTSFAIFLPSGNAIVNT